MPCPGACRVVICGAGIVGASIAYYLAQRGVASTLVEREEVACAASGKAGGFLALDWNDSSPVGAARSRGGGAEFQLGRPGRQNTLSLFIAHGALCRALLYCTTMIRCSNCR